MSNVKRGDVAKVLIVEDERPLRELLQSELRRSGHRVQVAGNGEEGLARYREEIFNVVLLDIRMPGSDGVEILKQMKSESSVPEIIMFTGHGTIETAVECIKHGAYDYLTKPVKLDELDLVITKAHEKNRLRLENISLKLEMQKLDNHQIVGKSQAITQVLDTVKRWGAVDEHVLIFGESGTGKELVARAVHESSPRAQKPFVTVNCGRLDVNTAESELFGHMQGAFTSAVKGRAGLFELAHQGTLFMDEVSEMTLDVQVKLLRILETGTFRRLGGNRDISVDVRFVFATNKKLEDKVDAGEFRDDLFHRINMLPILIPPLRERAEDILPLAWFFLQSSSGPGQGPWEISPEAMASLRAYHWPGNVRELRNTMRRASILAAERVITADLLPFAPPKLFPAEVQLGATPQAPPLPLWVIEREHIRNVLDKVEGNKSRAAKILEIDRKTLYTKLDRYDLPA
ncbi:two-component system, NtrC family, response regulator [Geoalkalibacter ferrihydriticus]|uniref:Fis family transcriptional regulator n=2 Tax=Geoalkalibacter ferrihydriticus TaxID=392333 RepID=A0A0C2DXD9_9BACT|nr:sigma-54 dependent transcriptional regulator [Geoalkalibacter ferrihydriticus]KIH78109.1 Fis family transcriptional regulator [Geoalkalibacter ferrihydriticus DSM 17813]SDM78889.1 two-component system, NtrC family, response regulator [Geoalkalibacter ferrihydriticus]